MIDIITNVIAIVVNSAQFLINSGFGIFNALSSQIF